MGRELNGRHEPNTDGATYAGPSVPAKWRDTSKHLATTAIPSSVRRPLWLRRARRYLARQAMLRPVPARVLLAVTG
jgi:hypothetical protein